MGPAKESDHFLSKIFFSDTKIQFKKQMNENYSSGRNMEKMQLK